eukprot:300891-Chlamydomonas_euryale.AAC.2
MERQSLAAASDRADKVTVSINVCAYAGMPAMLTAEQRQYFDKLFSDKYAPDTMRFWANPPQLRSVLPGQQPKAEKPPPKDGAQSAGPPVQRGGAPGPPGAAPGRVPPAPPARPAPGSAPPPVPQRPAPAPMGAMGSVRRAPPPPPPGSAGLLALQPPRIEPTSPFRTLYSHRSSLALRHTAMLPSGGLPGRY